jgi:UDP-GlcNAc:undecaprenyl-phosphate GlcNAc-1-phosphate transferase
MLGATLGFLLHNFNPASIFMGDSGSLFLGFMISVIGLLGFKATTLTSLIIPICILAIPILDTTLAIFRRLLKGESIGAPDKEHFHHQLLKMKFGVKGTVLMIYAINILFAAVSIFFVLGDKKMAMAIYVVLMLMLLFLVLKTDILFAKAINPAFTIGNNVLLKIATNINAIGPIPPIASINPEIPSSNVTVA